MFYTEQSSIGEPMAGHPMRAMVLTRRASGTLDAAEREIPPTLPGEILIKVNACGVCRTDLHVVDGELPQTDIPIVPGHEIVGRVAAVGDGVPNFMLGDRVGVPWLGYSCEACEYCASGRENLCPNARFTGCQLDGGYAEYAVADARYVFRIPERYEDAEAAPLLCAGLIGYRAYRMTNGAKRLGLYGFGAAAHILCQVAVHDGRTVYAFTSPRDDRAQAFARECGATWAGASTTAPPDVLDAAIIFAPVGSLIPQALGQVGPGGVVVCAGIHMSVIPAFSYDLLWEERMVRSVANLTRQDAREFLDVAARLPIKTHVRTYPLADANKALGDVRSGAIEGAAVLIP